MVRVSNTRGHVARTQLDEDVVIETAATIADEEGLDAMTLTRVAKELGISQPALYRHVEGYDDLLRSAFHGFAHLEAGDGHPKPHDLDDTFDHIIDLLCAGVRRL